MKLIQANIWGGRLQNQMTDFLIKEKADILCLQESISTSGDGLIFTTVEEMQNAASYENAFISPVFEFKLMRKKARFGNTILTKNYSFKKQETVFTSKLDFEPDFDFDVHHYNIRNFQHAVLEINGKQLNILNHHGHQIPQHKNGDSETMRQCEIIANYISNLSGPIILTGDFNLSPDSESIQQINDVIDNLSIRYGLKTTRTPLTNKTEVCDYIFVSPGIKVNDFYASDDLISDHQALILEFEI